MYKLQTQTPLEHIFGIGYKLAVTQSPLLPYLRVLKFVESRVLMHTSIFVVTLIHTNGIEWDLPFFVCLIRGGEGRSC